MKDLQGRAKNIVTLGSQILDEDAMIYLTGKMSPKLTEKETAAVEMMHTLKEYNQHRQKINYAPVDIGIGIYTGLLMLWTVGEEKRINGSVISEAVNLISRLEGLIKIYKSSIIISKTTMESLSDPKKFNIRFMDKLRVNGKNKPVLI
jgi:two-component system sensor histidine kinase ChiS